MVAHTAGSFGIDIFPEQYYNKEEFFIPADIFTGRKVDFKDLPFFLESSDKQSSAILEDLAESIGGKDLFC